MSKLRARRIQSADFERFHWLLAMDAENLKRLGAMAPPDSPARICLLLDYARRFVGEREVPDPYYGAPAGFERVLDLVEDACGGFLNYLVETGNFLSKA